MSNHTTNDSPKLCECGCGQPAPIAKATDKSRGRVKGQPMRFIHNHHFRGSGNVNFRPVLERFWEKVDKRGPDDCWLWTGSHHGHGYGLITIDGRSIRTHRFMYELVNGPIPGEQHVLHTCDQTACVNPTHLFLGTHQDNMTDMYNKNRRPSARGAKHHATKLTEEQVREIRQRRTNGESGAALAREYGITSAAICAIFKRKNWRHVS